MHSFLKPNTPVKIINLENSKVIETKIHKKANYPKIFNEIDAMGYEGWIGCEYIPAEDTISGLKWALPYLQ